MADKLTKQYCVSLDENTARMVETIAELYQRKGAELLRLLVLPAIRNEWAKIQREEHQENKERPTLARFTGGLK